MDWRVMLAKGFNTFILLLIVVQFLLLLGIIVLLSYLGSGLFMSIITAVSTITLVVLCLPLSVLQYFSSRDRKLKVLFAGLIMVFLISSLAVIIWYLAEFPGYFWLTDVTKFLTLLTYLPLLVSLLAVSRARDLKIEPYNKAAIVFLSVVSALVVAFYALANAGRAGADTFGIINYTVSILLDIVVLALTSVLILTHLQGKLRYLLSIILITYLLSTVADVAVLIDSLNLYEAFDVGRFVYAIMINFTGLALLAYSLGNIKVITVEEVSRKLNDVTLLMSDLVEQSPLAICICDTTGAILMANDRFLDICGLSRPDAPGGLTVIQALPEAGKVLPPLSRLTTGTGAFTVDGLRIERAGKAPAYFRMKAFPTRGSDGLVASIVIILDDVTERKAFEDQLVIEKKQTELYVDLMGHDVNNMNQIAMGFLEIAEEKLRQEGRLGEDDLYLLSKPIEALAHNSRIIYNIRKLQQEKAGEYRHKPVDVGETLAGVTSRYSGLAGRDVRVSLCIGEDCTVMANELLGEVFDNLVGNAVKHTEGPVCIRVAVDKISGAGGKDYCRVTVEDDGQGITDEMKGKLFDRLSMDNKRARGSGFGLCLSKILVEDFGGRLEVEDRVQGDYTKGAKFVVTLPLITDNPR
ncbi:ATP-binding protein [Methanocella arvoryzae]|uniref:histidine kinase n=1 Tax=Methanocella arvoryzae (strain DSM 22066 / NBRC 105507 / MRE50) TaxID=351160 RepID=Q0W5Y2_METAR|nr:ATP-binding protein [Methanocella arvoryzae]CAJ36211.1 putative signal transduction histidine kinase [Methanocella arvoryzae MRE50]